VFCKALEEHGIRHYSVKFTGGTGFHIGVPWGSMPDKIDYKTAKSLFPDLPRAMCMYMREYCRDELEKALLKLDEPEKLAEQAGIKVGELLSRDGINPFKLVDIDPVLISPRHLFRMPYSLNMKSSLVSLPVKSSELSGFEKRMAEPGRFKAALGFLDSDAKDEAGALVVEAMDWQMKNRKATRPGQRMEFRFSRAVEPEHFPPCIKRIMEGLEDGKKRSLFILINFLSSVGWKWDAIEHAVFDWNSRNIPSLPENYIRTHMRWSRSRAESQGRGLMPPGCRNEGWYSSIGVCMPDETCGGASKSVGNPAVYPVRKLGRLKQERKAKQTPAKRARTGRRRERQGRDSFSVDYM